MKLAGKLPAGDGNGLGSVEQDMIAQAIGQKEKTLYVAIAIVDVQKVTTDADTGQTEPTARIRRIEIPLDGEDRKLAESLMRRALDSRMGRDTLPYDLEQELRGVFDAATGHTVDPGSGEVQDDDDPPDEADYHPPHSGSEDEDDDDSK